MNFSTSVGSAVGSNKMATSVSHQEIFVLTHIARASLCWLVVGTRLSLVLKCILSSLYTAQLRTDHSSRHRTLRNISRQTFKRLLSSVTSYEIKHCRHIRLLDNVFAFTILCGCSKHSVPTCNLQLLRLISYSEDKRVRCADW